MRGGAPYVEDRAAGWCFNHVIGSSYTMTRWSVRFSGRHETEYITAVSHLPYGDFDFVLKNGTRSRVTASPAALNGDGPVSFPRQGR